MSTLFRKIMQEATRLTRNGSLQEATRAIQQALGRFTPTARTTPPQPDDTPAPWTIDGCVTDVSPVAGAIDVIEVVDVISVIEPPLIRPTPPLPAEPAADDGPGEFTAGSFEHSSGIHSYKLYTPPAAAAHPQQALPLVLMLHGCTQNPDDFANGTGMNALAREHGFVVLYPEQSRDANSHRCWNWFNPVDQQRNTGEPAWLAALVRQVMAERNIDPRRVFVAGLSAGGAMASILGHTYPDLFAAVGVHSGLASGVANNVITALSVMKHGRSLEGSASSVPTIVFHGDADATVHPRNGETVVRAVVAHASHSAVATNEGISVSGQRYTRTTYLQDDGSSIAEYWNLHGAGHAWSGGDTAGSYTDPQGPNASSAMWRFFQEHPHAMLH